MSHLPQALLDDLPKLDDLDLATASSRRRRSNNSKDKPRTKPPLHQLAPILEALDPDASSGYADANAPGTGGLVAAHHVPDAVGRSSFDLSDPSGMLTAAGVNFAGRVSPSPPGTGGSMHGSHLHLPAAASSLMPAAAQVQASRKEVVALRDSMHAMLAKLGASDVHHEYPTEIRALLRLAEDEHVIYDTVFKEMVRQVTLHMVERGEILGDLRTRYANMFTQIPKTVKNVYSDLVAQRAINKRLAAEILRTRDAMRVLADHLTSIKRSDAMIAEQGPNAERSLLEILAHTEHVDETLAEYHNLYRLQRQRLEQSLRHVEAEKKVWVDAATHLALRIGSEHGLPDVAILQKYEYGRVRAVNHIISIMADQFRADVAAIEAMIEDWMARLIARARDVEREEAKCLNVLAKTMREVRMLHSSLDLDADVGTHDEHFSGATGAGMGRRPSAVPHARGKAAAAAAAAAAANGYHGTTAVQWDDPILQPVDPGEVKTVEKARMLSLYEAKSIKDSLKKWLDYANTVSVRYTSDRDEHIMNDLSTLQKSLDGWISAASTVLRKNEKSTSGELYVQLQEKLAEIKSDLESWIMRLKGKASGDDGVAGQVISLQNQLEDKYSVFSSRDNSKPLNGNERIMLSEALVAWNDQLSLLTAILASNANGEEKRLPMVVESWLGKLVDQLATDSELRSDQNVKLHNTMVRWMVHLLIKTGRQVPDESWDRELDEIEIDVNAVYERLIQDCGDAELLSDDRKDLRLVTRSYCDAWMYTAKRLLETEKQAGIIQIQRRQSQLGGLGSNPATPGTASMRPGTTMTELAPIRDDELPDNRDPDADAKEELRASRRASFHAHSTVPLSLSVIANSPALQDMMTSRELDVLTGPASAGRGASRPSLAATPSPARGMTAPRWLAEMDDARDVSSDEILEFDSYYLDAGREGHGSYPDLMNVPSVPRSEESPMFASGNGGGVGGGKAGAAAGTGAGKPALAPASTSPRLASRRSSVM
ncbi:hypothetical protein AMAG_03990 [Allomyces macrogynus ATCC 38327]|uniref:Uncharacterized protein n=1 Tax=Allomyces macrogynus (strain ATCC 38327) TaxID=578462 RepID=A0A0L0S7C3_ALLM3|nr:hypothetical protein AMAG_03990 [Allomyces macrogynus ATCC 38327]|eukprot:KNE58417.1 hypothetical protein AMAG_03990 [Allomyces macrogynus ATCC 38327]